MQPGGAKIRETVHLCLCGFFLVLHFFPCHFFLYEQTYQGQGILTAKTPGKAWVGIFLLDATLDDNRDLKLPAAYS
jgi:hypothetical protein